MPHINQTVRKLYRLVASTGLGRDVSEPVLNPADRMHSADLHPIQMGDVLQPLNALVTIESNQNEKSRASYQAKSAFQNVFRGFDFDFNITVKVNKLLLPLMSEETPTVVDDEATYSFTVNYHKNEKNTEFETLITQLETAAQKLNIQDRFVCAYNETMFAFSEELAAMRKFKSANTENASYQTIETARAKLREAYEKYRDSDSVEALNAFRQVIQTSQEKLTACKKDYRNILIPLAILGLLAVAAFIAAVVMAFILVPPAGVGMGIGGGLALYGAAHAAAATTAATTLVAGTSMLSLLPIFASIIAPVLATAMQMPWISKLYQYQRVSKSLDILGTFQAQVGLPEKTNTQSPGLEVSYLIPYKNQ